MASALTPTAEVDLRVTTEAHCLFSFLPIPNPLNPQEAPLAVSAGYNAIFRLRLPENCHFPSTWEKGVPSDA